MAKKAHTDSHKSNPKKNKKSILVKVTIGIVAFFILLGLLVGSFFGYQKVYAGKIYPGITIGGVEVWGENKDAAKALVQEKITEINQSEITLLANGQENKVKIADLGLTYNIDELVNSAYAIGREDNFQFRVPKVLATLVKENNILLSPKVDDNKIREILEKIYPGLNKDPKNATFKVNNGELILVLSEEGSNFDLEKFKADLVDILNNGTDAKKITLSFKKASADISEEDVSGLKDKIERIIKDPIISNYNYFNYEADSEEIASWLLVKKDNYNQVSLAFNDEAIKSYIEYIAKKIDQKAVDKQIRSDNGEVVSEGKDGMVLDQAKMLASIKAILLARVDSKDISNKIDLIVEEKLRGEKKVSPEDINTSGGTPGLYEGKYLEVNLSEQTLYCWDGTKQECRDIVSTGKWDMPTPTGTRYIEDKSARAYSAKYDLYMPYWNGLGGGYGIHELPEWDNGYKEGESHLGTPVSHGCIRLGVGAAEFVYNWAPIGTVVYIHN